MKNIVGSFKGIFLLIDKLVYIDVLCWIVGDVKIEKDSSVWFLVVVWGDVNKICIGVCFNI